MYHECDSQQSPPKTQVKRKTIMESILVQFVGHRHSSWIATFFFWILQGVHSKTQIIQQSIPYEWSPTHQITKNETRWKLNGSSPRLHKMFAPSSPSLDGIAFKKFSASLQSSVSQVMHVQVSFGVGWLWVFCSGGGFCVFFLLAAAWVDPGRNALQSAEQRC